MAGWLLLLVAAIYLVVGIKIGLQDIHKYYNIGMFVAFLGWTIGNVGLYIANLS